MNTIRASIKLILFLLLTLLAILPQILCLIIIPAKSSVLPQIYHKVLSKIIGIKVSTQGTLLADQGTVYVSNHISYLDIIVLYTKLRANFIAKSDVASWPLFGFLAKISQTIFIERTKAGLKEGSAKIESYLKKGKNLILFPEGTSTSGQEVLPFKSGFFDALLKSPDCKFIQPITIELSSINENLPNSQDDFDNYAWHGDMTLVPHLWNFFTLKSCGIKITYHSPITITEDMNRKNVAKKCEEAVSIPFKNK